MAYKLLVLLLTALLTSPSNSAEAALSWIEPTLNEDGTPLTDLTSYEIHSGCNQSGVYDRIEIVPAPATSYTVLGLPDVGTCFFAAKATNSVGESSLFSNEAWRLMAQVAVPGAVTDTAITWQESQSMALVIEATDCAADSSNSTSATVTIDTPAYADADLVILNIGMWANGVEQSITWASGGAAGPNGETIVNVVNAYGVGTGDRPWITISYFIGDGSSIASTVTGTAAGTTRWAGGTCLVLAGEFDATTPISSATGEGNGNSATPDYVGFNANADDGGGKLVAFVAVDVDDVSANPTGWTELHNVDGGRMGSEFSGRDTEVSDSESISATDDWTIAGDHWAVFAYIVREASAGGGASTTINLTLLGTG